MVFLRFWTAMPISFQLCVVKDQLSRQSMPSKRNSRQEICDACRCDLGRDHWHLGAFAIAWCLILLKCSMVVVVSFQAKIWSGH